MDNIVSKIDEAYKKGISHPMFQEALEDLKEKISDQNKVQEKVVSPKQIEEDREIEM